MQTKKRKMKAGDALVGMKSSGSQLQDQGVSQHSGQCVLAQRVITYLRRQNIFANLCSGPLEKQPTQLKVRDASVE